MKKNNKNFNRLHKPESNLPQLKTLMTFEQALQYLGFSKHNLYRLCYRNNIPHYKPTGRKLFFFKEELDSWVAARPGKRQCNTAFKAVKPAQPKRPRKINIRG